MTPAHKAAKVQMAEDFIAKWEADPDFKHKVGSVATDVIAE